VTTAPRHLEHDWYDQPLPESLVVGERSWIYSSFAFLHDRTVRPGAVRIGRDSGIYMGTLFALGPEASVEIGDYCAVAGPIISMRGRLVIGDYAFISYGVVFADDPCAVPPGTRLPEGVAEPAPTEIVLGQDVWIGAGAVVLGGARIGDGAIVGARCVVDFEVPAGATVAGNPARIVKGGPGS
jgi:acetyltransferase-like isoleucine patch superfamily enzyme